MADKIDGGMMSQDGDPNTVTYTPWNDITLVLGTASVDDSSQVVRYNDLYIALQAQITALPAVLPTSQQIEMRLMRTRMWGPYAGSLQATFWQPELAAATTVGVNTPARSTQVDIGTGSTRPNLSYEWPISDSQFVFIAKNATSTFINPVISFNQSNGATGAAVVGVSGVIHIHVLWRSSTPSVDPAKMYIVDIDNYMGGFVRDYDGSLMTYQEKYALMKSISRNLLNEPLMKQIECFKNQGMIDVPHFIERKRKRDNDLLISLGGEPNSPTKFCKRDNGWNHEFVPIE